ncbi:MAG: sulfotransferase [Planctomycetota bacterium]
MMPYRLQQAAKRVGKELAIARGMLHWDTHGLSGTVLLAGSGRSGTTWMSQIIHHGGAYRDLFEPFHPQQVRQMKDWHAMRYLRANQGKNESTEQIRALLEGRVRSRWTDQYNRKTFPQGRLIKAIRTNLMLGWINNHCPEVKLLFAMRHPCAVVHSRVKLQWDTHLDQLLAQPGLVRDHLEPYRGVIERAERSQDPWQKHLAMWCIENLIPLRELSQGDAHLLRYEDLCQDFDGEVARLFTFLDRPVPNNIHNIARQRSAHFRRDSAILQGGDLIADWQKQVEPKHIDAMLDMLSCFGLNHLYDERAMPRCQRDGVFIDPSLSASPISIHKDAA